MTTSKISSREAQVCQRTISGPVGWVLDGYRYRQLAGFESERTEVSESTAGLFLLGRQTNKELIVSLG